MHSWKKTILLYEHQWNTRWAFAHKQDIFHMKITCYLQKWLWLQKPLKRTQMCSCVIETSSVLPQKSLEIFGNFQQMFRNDWLVLGQLLDNLQKSLKNRLKSFHWYVYIVNRILSSTRYITCSQDSLMRLDITLNTWREIPYLRAPMYYPSYISSIYGGRGTWHSLEELCL